METTMRQLEHLQPLNRIESKTGPLAGYAPRSGFANRIADLPGIVAVEFDVDTPAERTTKVRQVPTAAPLSLPKFSRTNLQ